MPEKYHGRPTYYHNPEFTLVRLTHDEQIAAAKFLVDKLNRATGLVTVINPLAADQSWIKQVVRSGNPTSTAIRELIKAGIKPAIRYLEHEGHINDGSFAEFVSQS